MAALHVHVVCLCFSQVIHEMPMGEFLDEFFFMSSQFNPLKLTDGEVGLFTSILIICPCTLFDLFSAELSPEGYWCGPRSQ